MQECNRRPGRTANRLRELPGGEPAA